VERRLVLVDIILGQIAYLGTEVIYWLFLKGRATLVEDWCEVCAD